MLTYAGVFASFTYLRPFLERYMHVSLPQLSLLLLGLGLAGFAGTYGATALVGRHLFSLLRGLPMALAAVTIGMLAVGHALWGVAAMMVVWGTLNSAIPAPGLPGCPKASETSQKAAGASWWGRFNSPSCSARVSGDCCSTIFRLRHRSLEALFCWRSLQLP